MQLKFLKNNNVNYICFTQLSKMLDYGGFQVRNKTLTVNSHLKKDICIDPNNSILLIGEKQIKLDAPIIITPPP